MIFALGCVEVREPLYFDAPAAAAEDSAEPCAPDLEVTWDNWGRSFVTTHCQGCHADDTAERYGAPESVSFDSEADALSRAAAIYRAVLREETMPPSGGLTEDERYLLDQWLCRYL